MTHRLLLIALTVGVLASGLVAQDPDKPDEPLRLKKKKKPDEPMKEPDKKVEEPKPADPMQPAKEPPVVNPITTEEEEKELLERVARNMRKVEDQLLNKELNEATLQTEDDILKDLDALIKKAENDSGGGGGGGQDNPDMGEQGNKQPQGGQQGGMGKQSRQKGQKGQPKGQKGQQGKNQPGQGQPQGGMNQQGMNQQGMNPQGMNQGMNPGMNPMGGQPNDPNAPPDRIADLYKDVWGHLPETVRAQMNAYAGKEEYMQKHRDLIKQYYRALAEQGQKNK